MSLPYKNYIFDLYGTLADIRTDERRRELWVKTALYCTENGAPYKAAELRREYLRLCRAEQERHRDPLYEIELRKVFRALYEAKGAAPDRRRVEETAVFFRLLSLRKLTLYPWVEPVFAALRERGARLFLLSNAQACFTVPELRALGLDGAFDGVVLSSDTGVRKPDPAIMGRLLKTWDLDPADCLMTGNDRYADVAVARSCGVDCLYIQTETSGPFDPAFLADRELTDGNFSRLPELLGL
jgi:putative hydrolase of the HAD superfamily